MEALSTQKIRDLWLDPKFPGHGLGLISFRHELESRFHVKLSDKYVKSVLIEIPEYLQNIIRKKKINRRNYNSVHGFMDLMQVDFAEFPKFHSYNFVFCAIDCYTQFLWTTVTENKTSETVKAILGKIFSKFGKPQTLEFDEGGEFRRLVNSGFFEENKIVARFKKPPNKACFVGL